MPTTKRSITVALDPKIREQIEALVAAGEAPTISEFVKQAILFRLNRAELVDYQVKIMQEFMSSKECRDIIRSVVLEERARETMARRRPDGSVSQEGT